MPVNKTVSLTNKQHTAQLPEILACDLTSKHQAAEVITVKNDSTDFCKGLVKTVFANMRQMQEARRGKGNILCNIF